MAVDVQLRAALENLIDGNVDRVEGLFEERTYRNLFKWTFRLEGGAANGDADIGLWRTITLSSHDLLGGRILMIRADDTTATDSAAANTDAVDVLFNVLNPGEGNQQTDGVMRVNRFLAGDMRIATTSGDETTGIAYIALRARGAAGTYRTVTLYLIANSDFVGSA